jgi:hypothetical protein
MKRIKKLSWLLTIVLFCGITNLAFSQTLKDVFTNSESPIIYLGIDFSKSKLLDNGNAAEIRNKFYVSINQVVVSEPKKYDLKGAFLKGHIDYDFSAVTKSNAQANLNEILSTASADFYRFKESDVTAIVKQLDLSGKTGVGLLFVMEAMRKQGNKGDAAIWVTFIDMKTKKVLMTERTENKGSGGIGFRNYWVSPVKQLIEDIAKYKYKEWQAKYGG